VHRVVVVPVLRSIINRRCCQSLEVAVEVDRGGTVDIGHLPEHHYWANVEGACHTPGIDLEGLGEQFGVISRDELVNCMHFCVILVSSATWVGLGQR